MGPRPRGRRELLPILLIVILIVHIGIVSYALLDLQRNLEDLQSREGSDFASLTRSIERLRSDLGQLQPSMPSGGLSPSEIYELSQHSVVLITAKQRTFYGLEPFSSGSGFIYDREGHIVTNNHVIENADVIEITFPDGTIAPAEPVGSDPYSDLAIVRVETASDLLHPLTLGRSSELRVGESVLAIGNPFGLSNSMSLGIVSQLGRDIDAPGNYKIVDVIQTDAAINPGNSGGPLMNMRGEVVGVNTAIIQGSVGVGFAIPSDTVSREVLDLIQTGQYSHPWIGISSVDLDPDIAAAMGLTFTKGTLVVDVAAGSPAEAAGIKAGTKTVRISGRTITIGGDVIVAVDGIPVRKLTDMMVYIERTKKPGDRVTFSIIRAGKALNLDLILGVRPPP